MIKKMILMVFYVMILSCKTDSAKYESYFTEHRAGFDNMVSYIQREIIVQNYKRHKAILVFVAKRTKSPRGNFLYDDDLAKLMIQNEVKEVSCEYNELGSCGLFSQMIFQMRNENSSGRKATYFIYNKCDENDSYERKYLYQKKLRTNWVLFIDET
ncbi:hypothetical protein EZ428_15760 [Pedobacter frigiditerrae]|uniref:Lipoprotein n=1 Tax=Pedobacter frigiditerrae TaxID=2530452 RepID=A0A4V2MI62_9SPHI|nr:hypothetical protein [Pedobacter frigiditerrae]TCC89156.1 hypothetical protein EZ428_15760 [Pedobacter frigiditerrae]